MAYLREGIHERFDSMEKAIQVLVVQQKTKVKKLEQLMACKVFKSIVLIKDYNFRATVKPVTDKKDFQPAFSAKMVYERVRGWTLGWSNKFSQSLLIHAAKLEQHNRQYMQPRFHAAQYRALKEPVFCKHPPLGFLGTFDML